MTSETEIAKFTNDAFYLAFNARDIEQMSALWSRECPVVCIHPGWPPLYGYEEVMQSWSRIFENQTQESQITCHQPRVFDQQGLISVVCYEEMQGGWLIATNNFVMEKGSAVMVHHQAGLCPEPQNVVRESPPVQ
jgi:ketosteroid isomerase-like protein